MSGYLEKHQVPGVRRRASGRARSRSTTQVRRDASQRGVVTRGACIQTVRDGARAVSVRNFGATIPGWETRARRTGRGPSRTEERLVSPRVCFDDRCTCRARDRSVVNARIHTCGILSAHGRREREVCLSSARDHLDRGLGNSEEIADFRGRSFADPTIDPPRAGARVVADRVRRCGRSRIPRRIRGD